MRGSQPWRTNRARVLRSQPISAEARLWAKLKDRRLGGFKFVRQAPVDGYFVDFLCRDRKVVIEVDGSTHDAATQVADDEVRTAELERFGYRVFRVSNRDVYDNVERVLDASLAFVEEGD